MRTFLKIIATICLSLFVAACGKNSEEPATDYLPLPVDEELESSTSTTPLNADVREFADFDGNLKDQNFKVELSPAEFGKYVLSLRWTSSIETMQVRVNDGPTMTKRSLYEHTQKVEAGKTAKIYFSVLNNRNEIVSAIDVDIQAPVDFLITEPLHLKEDTEWRLGRLHILPGGQIMTNGAKLTIHADEIHHHQPEFTAVNLDMGKHSIINLQSLDGSRFIGNYGEININIKKIIGGFSIYSETSQVGRDNGTVKAFSPLLKIKSQDKQSGSISIVRKSIHSLLAIEMDGWIITNIDRVYSVDFYEVSR